MEIILNISEGNKKSSVSQGHHLMSMILLKKQEPVYVRTESVNEMSVILHKNKNQFRYVQSLFKEMSLIPLREEALLLYLPDECSEADKIYRIFGN
jgi:hypothetical protein